VKARSTFVAIALALATIPASAIAGEPFNFEYQVGGDRMIQPVAVFDDGATTYFQFRGQTPPAVFADDGGRRVLVTLQPRGPYYTADKTASSFVLIANEGGTPHRDGALGAPCSAGCRELKRGCSRVSTVFAAPRGEQHRRSGGTTTADC
jgi:Conjugal transfer protein